MRSVTLSYEQRSLHIQFPVPGAAPQSPYTLCKAPHVLVCLRWVFGGKWGQELGFFQSLMAYDKSQHPQAGERVQKVSKRSQGRELESQVFMELWQPLGSVQNVTCGGINFQG